MSQRVFCLLPADVLIILLLIKQTSVLLSPMISKQETLEISIATMIKKTKIPYCMPCLKRTRKRGMKRIHF
ncbi:hypothetical protein EDC94DRAFT_607220 [Helicostylum pulchrum]|nr:hypothetical protein EDC94DRAFT_607220 [Helicostylum pulchrum]